MIYRIQGQHLLKVPAMPPFKLALDLKELEEDLKKVVNRGSVLAVTYQESKQFPSVQAFMDKWRLTYLECTIPF